MTPPFEALDFVYMPSRDVAADVRHFTETLGGELVFAIEAFGTRVAMVQLTPAPPALLLAGLVTARPGLHARGARRPASRDLPADTPGGGEAAGRA